MIVPQSVKQAGSGDLKECVRQVKTEFDGMAEVKASVRRLIAKNEALVERNKTLQAMLDDSVDTINSLARKFEDTDRAELNRIIGQIGQDVIDGKLTGVGKWYGRLRKLAE